MRLLSIHPVHHGPLAWGVSVVLHVAVGVALARFGAVPIGIWESGVVKGQAVTLLASIAAEEAPPPEPTVTVPVPWLAEPAGELMPGQTKAVRLPPSPIGLLPMPASADAAIVDQPPPVSPDFKRAAVAEDVSRPQTPEHFATVASRPSPAMVATSAAVAGAADDVPRKLANNPAPDYPAEAIAAGWEGSVLVQALISTDGSVLRAAVARSSGFPSLDASALKAVKQWRFAPARRHEQAIEQEVLLPVRFRIDRG